MHGASPVKIQAAVSGTEVSCRASLRPFRIIQSPIMAPIPAPRSDNEAIHDASCCVTENDVLCL